MAFLALRSSTSFRELFWMPHAFASWADVHGVWRNVIGFFGFGLVVLTLLRPRLPLVIALCAFGTALEVAQLWIPTRVFDWRDIVASIGGILLAWPVAWFIRRRPAAA